MSFELYSRRGHPVRIVIASSQSEYGSFRSFASNNYSLSGKSTRVPRT